mgnify:CR=1 FL=1
MSDMDSVIHKLKELSKRGIYIAIDDFGTGYSSLSYLKRLPVNTLKIDRSFIMHLPGAAKDLALVNAILSMAKSLSLNVVAEGVETEMQAAFLKSAHCQYVQGYFYSKPLAQRDFIDYLRKHANRGVLQRVRESA